MNRSIVEMPNSINFGRVYKHYAMFYSDKVELTYGRKSPHSRSSKMSTRRHFGFFFQSIRCFKLKVGNPTFVNKANRKALS